MSTGTNRQVVDLSDVFPFSLLAAAVSCRSNFQQFHLTATHGHCILQSRLFRCFKASMHREIVATLPNILHRFQHMCSPPHAAVAVVVVAAHALCC